MTSAGRLVVRALAVERGGRRLVDGLDLDCAAGSVLALVGPSGCGKSSLLMTLAGWLAPAAGGVAVDPLHPNAVALLPQDLGLALARSALANAACGALPRRPFHRHPFGPTAADKRDALALLERLGIGDRAWMPARRLSGGERQRCAVARTLLAAPPVLLFDEPVSQLDDDNARRTLGLIRDHARASGAVVVASLHQRHLVAGCADRVLEAGADGPRWRLMEASAWS